MIATDSGPTVRSDIHVVRAVPKPSHDQPITAVVSGRLDETTADVFADEVVDLVFALPPRDLVLDLRDVAEMAEAGADAIGCAHRALDDQGAHLVLLCPHELEAALEDADVEFDIVWTDT